MSAQYVEYVAPQGINARAVITSAQWTEVGVTGSAATVWSAANEFRLPANGFTPAQLDYLRGDVRFIVTEADAGTVPAQ